MNTRQFLTAGLLIAAVACAGAGDRRGQTTVDEAGESPQRIVSLIPSATATIVALGAGDRLVARSDYDVDPALANLPSIGQGLTPSLEQLTLLAPDLVIAWPDNPSRSVISRLGELGVEIYAPEAQTLADVRRTTVELGRRLGRAAAADSLIASIDAQLADVVAAVAGRDRPSVFYVVWYQPPTTTGSGTYISELIEIAGGRNSFADAPGHWPQVSLEEVVRRQPDIILFATTAEDIPLLEQLAKAPGWRELAAVREGRVVRVDANLFNRPGPGVAEAARRLARVLHPEVFPDQAPR